MREIVVKNKEIKLRDKPMVEDEVKAEEIVFVIKDAVSDINNLSDLDFKLQFLNRKGEYGIDDFKTQVVDGNDLRLTWFPSAYFSKEKGNISIQIFGASYGYELTHDTVFKEGKTYYLKSGEQYAVVTVYPASSSNSPKVGDTITENTFYEYVTETRWSSVKANLYLDENLSGDSVESLSGSTVDNIIGRTDSAIKIVENVRSALYPVLETLGTLLQSVAYTSADHNASQTISSIDYAKQVLEGASSITLCSITKTLTGCSLSNPANSAIFGNSYTTTVIPNSGYIIDNIIVTMGGANITSYAWDSSTSTISISNVSANITIQAAVIEEYTAETIYENYTTTGTKFYTDDISINWDNGDYVEAELDLSSENIVDNSNVLGISPKLVTIDGNASAYLEMSTGKGVLFYKREKNGHNFNLRIVNVDETIDVTKYFDITNFSSVTIRITKTGIMVNNVWGENVRTYITNLVTNQSKIALGACSNQKPVGEIVKTLKVYRHN